MINVRQERITVAITLTVFGLLYSVLIGILAIALAGGGHGWNSGIWSGLGLFLLPAAGFAFGFLDKAFGRYLLSYAIIGMLLIDGWIMLTSYAEGLDYLRNILNSKEGFATWIFWLGLWIGWQIAVLTGLII